MEMNWLQGMIYGIVSGLTEFLPVSAEAHRQIFLRITGIGSVSRWYLLSVHLGALAALVLFCRSMMVKLFRERRLAAKPRGARRRQPDVRTLLDYRLLKTAGLSLLIGFILYPFTWRLGESMWLLALILGINGAILYIPQFMTRANKDSHSLSALDAFLTGLAGSAAIVPGISRVGAMVSAGTMRGADRRYALEMCLLLCIPAMCVLLGFDIYGVSAGVAVAVLPCILAGVFSLVFSYVSIMTMCYLAVKVGFYGFSYYSWGLGMFAFVLYLWF